MHDTLDQIALTHDPLAPSRAIAAVTDSAAGGIAVFLGTTRAEVHPDGRSLIALDYEAHPEMALAQLRDLASRARERWTISRLAIHHRIGSVPIGEPSVFIAVSTAHRSEAFEACRWLIDTLKSEVAIWKKEIWTDGSSTWVHPNL